MKFILFIFLCCGYLKPNAQKNYFITFESKVFFGLDNAKVLDSVLKQNNKNLIKAWRDGDWVVTKETTNTAVNNTTY